MLHSRSEKVPAPNVMKALLKLKELDQFTKQTNMLGVSGFPDKKKQLHKDCSNMDFLILGRL